MADSLARIRRDLFELREDLLELLVDGRLAADAGIPLEAFAQLVGLSPATLRKQIRSAELAVRLRWPAFHRPPGGRGDEHTTVEDVRRWRAERCKSSHPRPVGVGRLAG
jgi:hypothetical protein